MADNIEHQDKGELVANCDRFYSHRLKASCATNGYFYKLYGKRLRVYTLHNSKKQ